MATSIGNNFGQIGGYFSLATLNGYQLPPSVLSKAKSIAEETEVNITVTTDLAKAVADTDVIYTDV